jgi:hypothetical protein
MNFYHEQNILTISLDKKIDYKFTSLYGKLVNNWTTASYNLIELDFSQTEFITLAGAMYLIFPINTIINIKRKKGIYIETGITGYSKKLFDTLLNFGFISILKLYGNLHINPEIDRLSNLRLNFWDKSLRSLEKPFQSIYWPISTLPPKFMNNVDLEIHKFYNNFIDCFKAIIYSDLIRNLNYETLDYIEKYFTKSVNESTKNVWDHSESWGIAAIQSDTNNKTIFCLFDFGIGFINSYIKRKGSYERNVTADKEVLTWLFENNHTSNPESNNGHGLSIIQKFIDLTEGTLIVNTDRYTIKYNKIERLKIDVKEYYPGTQIMMNF